MTSHHHPQGCNNQINYVFILPHYIQNIARVCYVHRYIQIHFNDLLKYLGHIAPMGESRGAHRVLVGKPERKRQLERPRRRCEDNNKTEFKEVGWRGGGTYWIELAEDIDKWQGLLNAVINFQVT